MTRRFCVPASLCLSLLTGCQVAHDTLPWFGANDPVYSEQQLAAMNSSTDSSAGGAVADSLATQSTADNSIRTVSASNTVAPGISAQVEQIVQAGRVTIQQAGDNNPVMLQQARELFEQALKMDPNHSAANQGLAIVADLQKDWMTAETHYKRALSQNPQDADLLNDLGYSYLLQNRFHESMQYLSQALQVSPRHERAHINLALLSLKRGDVGGATTRLAMIYPQDEVQATLAQLQNELAKQATAPLTAQPGTMTAAAPTGQQPTTPTAPGTWPRNSAAATQPAMSAPAMHNYPAPGTNTAYAAPTNGAPNNLVPNNLYSNNTNLYAGNTPAATDNRPVSVYPPGVVLNESVTAQATAAAPSNSLATDSYIQAPATNQPVSSMSPQVPSGGVMSTPSNAPNFTGVPVGGVISTSPGMTSHQPAPNVGIPGPTASATPSTNAPVLGLNAGPGTLFPIPVQPATSGAPARFSNATQSSVSGTAPQYPNTGAVVPAPANYGAQPAATQPFYGVPGQPSPSQPSGYPAPPTQQPNAYYGQPLQNGSFGQPAPVNSAPAANGFRTPPGMTYPNTTAAPLPGFGGTQPMIPPTNGLGAVRGISGQHPSVPMATASNQRAGSAAPLIPGHLSAPSVPVATVPGSGRPSPLAAYEQQLQNLDNQYNATLQSMGQQGTSNGVPNTAANGVNVYR